MNRSFSIVGIGASAGGLEAFTQLLRHLPVDTGMGFVLVQHLDPDHESALVEILGRATALPVLQIVNDQPVEPDKIYVIPRDTRLRIAAGVLKLDPRPKGRVPHRPIDSFFESLAEDQRERAIGIVLSGTASDGTLGLEAIKAEGGITFAQDDSAKHDSMPRSAVAAGCVDLVASPADIARELARIARHPLRGASLEGEIRGDEPGEENRAEATAHAHDDTPLPSGGKEPQPHQGGVSDESSAERAEDTNGGYKKVLLLLRNHSGVDFSLYKSSTIQRRVRRRMILTKYETLADYAGFLRGDAAELDALYSDVLISVTSFFRNPEMFDILQRDVLPALLAQGGSDTLRCWVLGCSTGQEAYSIAMTFVEASETAPRLRGLQIFATDLNDALLDKARRGLYAKTLDQDISPERLRRFFVEEDGGYRVTKALRDMVVFARQNLIADPPFSRMDLISCRNLLIYLEPSLQRKALPTFHYALKPGGFLLLGASESIGAFTELFEPVDKKHKIYAKKAAPRSAFHLPVRKERFEGSAAGRPPQPSGMPEGPERSERSGRSERSEGSEGSERSGPTEVLRDELSAQREADRVTVHQFAPPGVLIDAELRVLQFRGPTGAFLEPPAGKASFDVLKMARQGLMLPLRGAIDEASQTNRIVRVAGVPLDELDTNGKERMVNLEVVPLRNLRERHFLIHFEEAGGGAPAGGSRQKPPAKGRPSDKTGDAGRIAVLEDQLEETREYLQVVQEQHEAANEELQAGHEEVQSANEELQSVNEELETSKEELESANEELTTVNEEMSNRNSELSRLNNDLVNLQNSTQLAVVLLGRDLSVRRFSAQAQQQFDFLASDLGRPIGRVRHNLELVTRSTTTGARSARIADCELDLEALLSEVIADVSSKECEVRDRAGRWFSLRARPYLTVDNQVDGAVLVLVDITDRRRAEEVMLESEAQYRALFNSMDQGYCVIEVLYDGEGTAVDFRYSVTNPAFEKLLGFRAEPGQSVRELIPDLEEFWFATYGEVARTGVPIRFAHEVKALDERWFDVFAFKIGASEGRSIAVLFSDVTESRKTDRALRQYGAEMSEADSRKNEFLALLAHELRNPLAAIRNAMHVLRRSEEKKDLASASAMVERQVAQMVRLVDDLLDISRMSRGKIDLRRERVDLAAVVQDAVEASRGAIQAAKQTLTVALPSESLFFLADPTRLAQVIGNLLHNASKFTGRGGLIALAVEATGPELESQEVAIRVRDNGIGIAPDQTARIFEMFTQADTSLERSSGGLGIGLALVKNLIELHGGTVDVESAGLGLGSEFIVRLPVTFEFPTPPAKPGGRELRVVTPLRILVVDDNLDHAASLALILQDDGHEIALAHDGVEAVEAAEEFRPQLILLDIGLPKLNGHEACSRIRAQPWGAAMTIVALTGWGQGDDRRKSKAAGFDDHLVKPLDVVLLLDFIANLPARQTG